MAIKTASLFRVTSSYPARVIQCVALPMHLYVCRLYEFVAFVLYMVFVDGERR